MFLKVASLVAVRVKSMMEMYVLVCDVAWKLDLNP